MDGRRLVLRRRHLRRCGIVGLVLAELMVAASLASYAYMFGWAESKRGIGFVWGYCSFRVGGRSSAKSLGFFVESKPFFNDSNGFGDRWRQALYHWVSPPRVLNNPGEFVILVPLGLPTVAILIPSGILMYLSRKRFSKGACLACGYNLRASPDRCPECGHPAPAR